MAIYDNDRTLFSSILDDTSPSKPDENQENVASKPPVPQRNLREATSPSSRTTQAVDVPVARSAAAASTTTNESKGFSSNISVSVPILNQTLQLLPDMNGSALEQPGIVLTKNLGSRDTVKPVLGRDDIFQNYQTGFPSGLSAGFELPTERDPPEYEGRSLMSDSLKFQTERQYQPPVFPAYGDDGQHGFSLQPINDVLQQGGVNVAQSLEEAAVKDIFSRNVGGSSPKPGGSILTQEISSDEDTPPPESLKNIKSVVRKRREAQRNTKPPSGKQRETKTSPKVVPRSAKSGGRGGTIGDKEGRKEKLRGKQGRTEDSRNVVIDDRFGWKGRTGVSSSRERKSTSSKSQKEKVGRKMKVLKFC